MTSAACSLRKIAAEGRDVDAFSFGDARYRHSASQLHSGVAQHYRRDAKNAVVVFQANSTIHVMWRMVNACATAGVSRLGIASVSRHGL